MSRSTPIFYPRVEAIARIDRLGAADEPFLFVVDYRRQRSLVLPLAEVDAGTLLYAFPSARNDQGIAGLVHTATTPHWQVQPEPPHIYRRRFDTVQHHLHAGNSYLVNLTCRLPLQTDLSLYELFLRAHAPYKLWLAGQFVCFSPETFLTIRGGTIRSYPMKGTIDATLSQAEQQLLADEKEAAEHATIVDLIRNDLSMVATQVHVARYRYVERIETHRGAILQTSSEVVGQLPADYRSRLGQILFSQLPAGSITGAPKPKTEAIIAEAEGYERGFYTGVMGICHRGELESAVMIRFIDQDAAGNLCFKAGGGITARSRWESEYEEILQKAYVPLS